jgi:hypothetical protein
MINVQATCESQQARDQKLTLTKTCNIIHGTNFSSLNYQKLFCQNCDASRMTNRRSTTQHTTGKVLDYCSSSNSGTAPTRTACCSSVVGLTTVARDSRQNHGNAFYVFTRSSSPIVGQMYCIGGRMILIPPPLESSGQCGYIVSTWRPTVINKGTVHQVHFEPRRIFPSKWLALCLLNFFWSVCKDR